MEDLSELGIKTNWYAQKSRDKTLYVGRYEICQEPDGEWSVCTRKGEYLDTFRRKQRAVEYAKSLNLG